MDISLSPFRWGVNSGAVGGVPERAAGGRLVGGHAPGTDRTQDVSTHPAVQRTLPPGTTHHPVTAPPQGQPLLARQGTFHQRPTLYHTGYPLHRENRENGQKKSLSGKTRVIWKFCQNTGNLVYSSCKFHDSKNKRHFKICRENLPP